MKRSAAPIAGRLRVQGATVRVAPDEHAVERIADFTRQYVSMANEAYQQDIDDVAVARAKQERRRLAQEAAAAEQRARILGKLKLGTWPPPMSSGEGQQPLTSMRRNWFRGCQKRRVRRPIRGLRLPLRFPPQADSRTHARAHRPPAGHKSGSGEPQLADPGPSRT